MSYVKVVGLTSLDGSINGPNVEPWFHIIVNTDGARFKFHAATKDGTSFYVIYRGLVDMDIKRLSLKYESMDKEAIRLFVNKDLCGEVNYRAWD